MNAQALPSILLYRQEREQVSKSGKVYMRYAAAFTYVTVQRHYFCWLRH
jgi:hypothetical protein